jgi:hypothetical protein
MIHDNFLQFGPIRQCQALALWGQIRLEHTVIQKVNDAAQHLMRSGASSGQPENGSQITINHVNVKALEGSDG